MKIVLINNLYKPYAVGGAEKVVEKQAIELVDKGYDVVIITTMPWRGWGSWIPQKGMEDEVLIYRFWSPNLCWYKNLSKHGFLFKLLWHIIDIWNWWSGRIVGDILENEKPDEVVLHNLMGVGYGLGIRNKELGKKLVLYLHDVQLVEPSGVLMWNHIKDSVAQIIYSKIMKRKFAGVNEVICPSKFLADFYQTRGFFKNSDFRIQIEEINKRHNSEVSDQKLEINFLFVGSLVEHKGIRILMEAWNSVGNNNELHIVGDGALRKEVEDWSKGKTNVHFHGRLEGDLLEEIYNKCDVLIFPSICLENRPTVIVEALERGLKVIASNTGGVSELVTEDCLVEPGNVEELTKRIENI